MRLWLQWMCFSQFIPAAFVSRRAFIPRFSSLSSLILSLTFLKTKPGSQNSQSNLLLHYRDLKPNLRLTVRDRMVIADVEAFACVLPCLTVKIKTWQRKISDGAERVNPLIVKIATDIPHDEYGHDCGLYVIKYTECIIYGKIDETAKNFDPILSRLHLAAQIFKHGCEKHIEEYKTNFDMVPRSVRRDEKMKGVLIA
ncbi:unnamed protein product [Fraxinus pennsylvanica]|uniref:Ubiquitin-like protease family profile domain-containing protein n=1 Tax=Fraxinus pennsylvanica TaxID=56036 RepID=A0AAD1ZYV6_9LAMI|nr:unnamed protein product [Fraxinus pennsylvanica]